MELQRIHRHYNDVIMTAMASQITSFTIVHSSVYSSRRPKKTLKLRVAGLCGGNSPVTREFPTQRASNAENVSTWWRHHGIALQLLSFGGRDASYDCHYDSEFHLYITESTEIALMSIHAIYLMILIFHHVNIPWPKNRRCYLGMYFV